MKCCRVCGEEIDGADDGDNVCVSCENMRDDTPSERASQERAAVARKAAARRIARREREAALRSCGLVKVRGAMGGTYWE